MKTSSQAKVVGATRGSKEGQLASSELSGQRPREIQLYSFTIRLLYLFAGAPRDTSVVRRLRLLASEKGWGVSALEVDIKRGVEFDLTSDSLRDSLLRRLRKGEFHVVLCTPPCSTWTRVRCANMRGPPPLRSSDFLWGFPWLKGRLATDVALGNSLVHLAIDVWEVVAQVPITSDGYWVFMFGEHPEDLGLVVREEDRLHMIPASIWQLSRVQSLPSLSAGRIHTVAINQCCWGTPWRKPTRLLATSAVVKEWGSNEWPSFDEQGRYAGPLDRSCKCQVSTHLARTRSDEPFKTTGTDAYPPALDEALAKAMISDLSHQTVSPPKVGQQGEASKMGQGFSGPGDKEGSSSTKDEPARVVRNVEELDQEVSGPSKYDLARLGGNRDDGGRMDLPPIKCYYRGPSGPSMMVEGCAHRVVGRWASGRNSEASGRLAWRQVARRHSCNG